MRILTVVHALGNAKSFINKVIADYLSFKSMFVYFVAIHQILENIKSFYKIASTIPLVSDSVVHVQNTNISAYCLALGLLGCILITIHLIGDRRENAHLRKRVQGLFFCSAQMDPTISLELHDMFT